MGRSTLQKKKNLILFKNKELIPACHGTFCLEIFSCFVFLQNMLHNLSPFLIWGKNVVGCNKGSLVSDWWEKMIKNGKERKKD